jgi:hypothetical protein
VSFGAASLPLPWEERARVRGFGGRANTRTAEPPLLNPLPAGERRIGG